MKARRACRQASNGARAAAGGGMIGNDTVLLPHVIADAVCREAAFAVKSDAPLLLTDQLAARAERCYSRNRHFARLLRRADGREWLYAFMRHWLAGAIKRGHPALFKLLPDGFAIGREAA